MGGEENRPALRSLPAHGVPEGRAGGGVHAGGRFVQYQQLRLRQESQCQTDALGLAAGAAGDLPAEHPAQIGLVDDRLDVGLARLEGGDDAESLADREGGDESTGLEDGTDAPGPHRLARCDSQNGSAARVGLGEAEDYVEGGGLAGPVGAEEGDNLAGGHGEIESVDGDDGAEGLAQTEHMDGGDGCGIGFGAHRGTTGRAITRGNGGAAHGSRIAPAGLVRY